MKSADMPAMATGIQLTPKHERYSKYPDGIMPVTGLTKREYFAAMAMQGYLASGCGDIAETSKAAVKSADSLLKELEGK